MAITFTPGLAAMSPQEKATEYKNLLGSGFSDAQIREAANANFGTQSDEAWSSITNLAGGLNSSNNSTATGALEQASNAASTATAAQPLTVEDLYTQYAGRAADPEGLAYWKAGFGDTIDPSEIASFQQSVATNVANGVESTATGLNYNPYFTANPDVAAEYMRNTQGLTPEQFAATHYQKYGAKEGRALPTGSAAEALSTLDQTAATGINTAFGLDGGVTSPTETGLLSGFDYIKSQNLDDASLRRILGEDAFNSYKSGLTNYATNNINSFIADDSITFDEARAVKQFADRYGYNSQQLADLTGKDKTLFDRITQGYNDSINNLVDGVLGADDVKTDVDKMTRAFSLQNTYKLTDAEIAAAMGEDEATVRSYLEPLRNYSGSVKNLLESPTASIGDLKKFISDSKANQTVSAAYADNLAALENYASEMDNTWTRYGRNQWVNNKTDERRTVNAVGEAAPPPLTLQEMKAYKDKPEIKLAEQILAQGTTGQWGGEGFGSAKANAKDMGRILSSIGIKDISEFGQIDVPADVAVTPVYEYSIEGYGDSATYTPRLVGYTGPDGKPVDPSLVQTFDTGGENSERIYSAKIGTQKAYGNKVTGQVVPNTYSERQTGNAWGGTFAGDGNTGYRVQFDSKGNPIFYTTGASSNSLANLMEDLGPLGQIGIAIATGGLSIPQQIAAQAAIGLASGKDFDDIARGALTSFALSGLSDVSAIKDGARYLDSIDDTGILSGAFKGATSSGVKAAFTGQEIGDALLSGAIGGGASGAIAHIAKGVDGFDSLTKTQQKMVTDAIGGVISGKKLDQVAIDAAITAGKSAISDSVKSLGQSSILSGGISNRVVDEATPQGGGDSATPPGGLTLASNDNVVSDAGNGLALTGVDDKTQGVLDSLANVDKTVSDLTSTPGPLTQAGDAATGTGVVVNPIDMGGPNTSTITTSTDDGEGNLQGAIDAATARNTVTIGNAEANDPTEAASLAKVRDPSATSFTFGGQTYNLTATDAQVRAAGLDGEISSAANFSDAFAAARRGGLGANDVFTWNGKTYSAGTAEERPDLAVTKTSTAPDQSDAETSRLTRQNSSLVTGNAPNQSAAETNRLANLNAGLKSMEKTSFLGEIYRDLNNQFNLNGIAANEYLRNNPNSPITASVSSAFEAAGELQRNLGGVALALDNKPLADAIIGGGNRLQTLGQSLGDAPQDTKNWNDTVNLISKASGTEKLAVLAGRIMDGTSGLSRQVGLELRQELPALFLGGGSLRATMLASGLIDTADTGGAAVVEAYDDVIKNGGTHREALAAGQNAGAAAAATEAAIQLTLGKLADIGAGKFDNVISKGTTRIAGEGAVEGAQEAGASAAVDLALGNAIDVNKALTQGVLGAAVGKGTAATTSPVDAATTSTVADAASTAGATGASNLASNTANLGSVGAVVPGADVVQGTDLGSIGSVTPGADLVSDANVSVGAGAAVVGASTDAATTASSLAATSMTNDLGNNVNLSTAFNNALSNTGTTPTSVLSATSSAVSTALQSNSNPASVVAAAIPAAVQAGGNINNVISSVVQATVNSGAAPTIAVEAAVQAAVLLGMNPDTALQVAMTASTPTTTPATNPATTPATTPTTTPATTPAITTTSTTPNVVTPTTSTTPTTPETPTTTTTTATTPETPVTPEVPTTPTTPATSTTTPAVKTTPPVVKPPVVKPKTTTKKKATTPSSGSIDITTVPQFLKGAPKEKAMQLAALRQLYDTLTPEMQEIFAERGITMPEEDKKPEEDSDDSKQKQDYKNRSKKDADLTYEEWLAEQDAKLTPEELAEKYSTKFNDRGITTKFAATGGTISEMKDTFNPNLKTSVQHLAGAPVTESPLKLMTLKHLREGIAKPPRAMGGLAQGGLPKKYADAAPEGHNPEFITGLTGYYASGKGTGQSDDIPAMLHDGDYVIDADAVAALGDGSSKAGAQALSQFQSKVPHKMSTGGEAVAAKIADGEYVFPAAFVSAIGGGDNKKGAKMLDAMREELRAHKRSAPTSKIPPKAKSPLDYLRMAKG